MKLQAYIVKNNISEGEYLLNDIIWHCVSGERQVVKWARRFINPTTAQLIREMCQNDPTLKQDEIIALLEFADMMDAMDDVFKLLTSKESDANSDDKGRNPNLQY